MSIGVSSRFNRIPFIISEWGAAVQRVKRTTRISEGGGIATVAGITIRTAIARVTPAPIPGTPTIIVVPRNNFRLRDTPGESTVRGKTGRGIPGRHADTIQWLATILARKCCKGDIARDATGALVKCKIRRQVGDRECTRATARRGELERRIYKRTNDILPIWHCGR
jgi:hypothetical protein